MHLMTSSQKINLLFRSVLEVSIVFAFGWWGYHTGVTQTMKIFLMIITPLFGFGFWGLIDFHQMGKLSEALRLIQELLISGLAAAALFVTGARIWGMILAIWSVTYHTMVYITGNRLLRK